MENKTAYQSEWDCSAVRRSESGMTIVELIISITMTGLLTGLLMVFFFSFWRQGQVTQAELNAITERLNASDFLREHISASTGFIIQNSIPDPNAGRPDPTDGASYWIDNHAYAGLKQNNNGVTPLVYFREQSVDGSRNVIMNGTLPYEDEYIIYLDQASQELRARTLANPAATNNRARSSCPPPGSSSCPADRILATGVTGVSMRYFNRTGNDISYSVTTVTDTSVIPNQTYDVYGPDFPVVEVVEFNLKLSKGIDSDRDQSIRSSTIIRVALRNS